MNAVLFFRDTSQFFGEGDGFSLTLGCDVHRTSEDKRSDNGSIIDHVARVILSLCIQHCTTAGAHKPYLFKNILLAFSSTQQQQQQQQPLSHAAKIAQLRHLQNQRAREDFLFGRVPPPDPPPPPIPLSKPPPPPGSDM